MLFDTHSHMDDERFDADRDALLEQIHTGGVGYIVNPGADLESSARAVELAHRYSYIYAAVGVHPHDTDAMDEEKIAALRAWAKDDRVVAIGEIGLDYYYDNSDREAQRYWFERQLELACEVGLPVIIHDRDAHGDCMEILKKGGVERCGGVMHCYSGSVEMAKEVLGLGMYISIAGPVTFQNSAKLPEVAAMVPQDRLLIETDSPYLTPEPYRGQRNHSGHVALVAQKIAQIRGMTVEEAARITAENAKRLFQITT